MFEKQIGLAPPGSDRKANYEIAQGLIEAIDRLTAVMANPQTTVASEEVPGFYVEQQEQPELPPEAKNPLDPPADAFPRFDSGESFEGGGE